MDEQRVWDIMAIPPRYRLPTSGENDIAVIAAWFEEILGKGGLVVSGSRDKAQPTTAAVELLKFAYKSDMGVGYFIDIYALLNDARNTTYSTEDAMTVWQHCKETSFLLLNNVADAFVFNEKEQRMLTELLVHRLDHRLYTIVVIYGEGGDANTLFKIFGPTVANILAGFAIKKVE